jgi:hypothetical protein
MATVWIESREHRSEIRGQRAERREKRAESRKQRAESREQRAETSRRRRWRRSGRGMPRCASPARWASGHRAGLGVCNIVGDSIRGWSRTRKIGGRVGVAASQCGGQAVSDRDGTKLWWRGGRGHNMILQWCQKGVRTMDAHASRSLVTAAWAIREREL